MSQRNSGYSRQSGDAYWTPRWVYDLLLAAEDFEAAIDVAPRDKPRYDFLSDADDYYRIATNPPFNRADDFVRHALERTKHKRGKVAMLLPIAWDTAKKRRDLWQYPFKAKYVLTKRIRWENLEQKKNGPSTNHAWYVWDWWYASKDRPPSIGWLP